MQSKKPPSSSKPRVTRFRDPLYEIKYRILAADDTDRATRLFKETMEDADGACDRNGQLITIWVRRNDPGLIAHECFHAARQVFRHELDDEGVEQEEAFACYLGWLVGKVSRVAEKSCQFSTESADSILNNSKDDSIQKTKILRRLRNHI